MERRIINPWQWQDEYGYVQADEVSGHRRVLFCAGQTSVDANGNPVHAGDMRAQVRQSLDNVEAVLTGAGLTFANVMRLNIYTTDVDGFSRSTMRLPAVWPRRAASSPAPSLALRAWSPRS